MREVNMKDSNRSALRVGVLIAVGLALLAFVVLALGHGARLLSGGKLFEAHFQRINGLQTGAPVTLRGVRVGRVAEIEFPDEPDADYVVVRLWIEKGAALRLRADSHVKIASLGLLGDKFVVLTGGTIGSPMARPNAVLASVDPVDYATLLQRKGTHDTLANILAISESVRTMTDAINNGHGLLHGLLYGSADVDQRTLTLQSLRASIDAARQSALDLDVVLRRAKSGDGIVGALLNGDGRRFDTNLQATAASARSAMETLDSLVQRYHNADGTIPQLMENRKYANNVMGNLLQSSADLEQILRKINTGQGTIGKLVNNPGLYDSGQKLLTTQGWGVAFIKALYGIAHPLSSSEPESNACSEGGTQPNLLRRDASSPAETRSPAMSLHENSRAPG
jgi:phospholipid/cholesterol/gamma-HCH transport system substrate-binding protein